MKDFFLADAAKHRGRNIRSHFLWRKNSCVTEMTAMRNIFRLTLCDRSGRIDGRLWDNAESWAAKFEQNDFVDVRACVDEFNGKLQLKVMEIVRG